MTTLGKKSTAEMPLASRNSSRDIRTSSPLIRKSNGSAFQSAFPGHEQFMRSMTLTKNVYDIIGNKYLHVPAVVYISTLLIIHIQIFKRKNKGPTRVV